MSAGVGAKGALFNRSLGHRPPGTKWKKKSRALKARFTSKHLFASGDRLKRAFSAWSVWLFRSWGEAPRLRLRSAFGAKRYEDAFSNGVASAVISGDGLAVRKGICAEDSAHYSLLSRIYLVKNPVNGLVADAALSLSANPISRASRPASMAFLNAFAMRIGSDAIAIAVFTSTASAPISIASAA